MRDTAFIVNALANNMRVAKFLEELKKQAKNKGFEPEVYLTRSSSDLKNSIQTALDKGAKTLVSCGGDGSLNHMVREVVHVNDVTVGVIPAGSGNDFVKSAGIPYSVSSALEILIAGKTTLVDVMKVEGDAEGYAINTIGCGFDGLANLYRAQTRLFKGPFAYTWGAVRAALHFKGTRFFLNIDGKSVEKNLMMLTLCNGKIEGGNFPVAPDADIRDGWLDALQFKPLPLFRLLWNIDRFKKGHGEKLKEVSRFRFREISITSANPIAVHADGEQLGTSIEYLKVTLLPGKIKMITGLDRLREP